MEDDEVTLSPEQEAAQNALLNKIRKTIADENKPLRDQLDKQGLELKRLGLDGGYNSGTPILDVVRGKKKEIENFLSGNARSVNFTVKTLATTGSITSSTQARRLTDVGQLATQPLTLRSLFQEVELGENSGGVVRYLDQSSVTRGADTKAEAAAKPESAIEWTEASLPIRKIPDSIPVTRELLTDFVQLADDIEKFLRINLALKVESQLWDGDGITPNLVGLSESATAFSGYAGTGVDEPNVYDLLTVLRAEMISSKGGKYVPDFVLMNPVDLALLRVTKENTEGYVFKQDLTMIAGMRVVECAEVVAGSLLFGDSRFAKIYTIGGGATVEIGYVGDQFKENKLTLLCEERLALLVRNADADGFMFVEDVVGALVQLGGGS
jgi:HK97 family phage major capsid protein